MEMVKVRVHFDSAVSAFATDQSFEGTCDPSRIECKISDQLMENGYLCTFNGSNYAMITNRDFKTDTFIPASFYLINSTEPGEYTAVGRAAVEVV